MEDLDKTKLENNYPQFEGPEDIGVFENDSDLPELDEITSLGEIGLSQFAPYLMNRIMGRWNNNLQENLRQHELSTVKMRTLAVLSIISGLTINELSVYTVIEQSTMSRSLDALETQQFIRRVASTKDGRVRKIYITDKGREIFDLFWPTMHDEYKSLFVGVSDAEHEVFLKTLQKLLNNIRTHDL